jgi:hypothetical protein
MPNIDELCKNLLNDNLYVILCAVISIIANIILVFSKGLLPYFEYRRKAKKDKIERETIQFNDAILKMKNLNKQMEECLITMFLLEDKKRNNTLTKEDIVEAAILYENWINDILTIADGILKNLTTDISVHQNTIIAIMKDKYNTQDNVIKDLWISLNKGKDYIPFKYRSIFKCYKNIFPWYKRLLGIVFKAFLKVK